jgi:hypothetical protein
MNSSSQLSASSASLLHLQQVPLDGCHRAILEAAQKGSGGPPALRHRLAAEARDLLALAQISGRALVHWLDLSAGLRAKIELALPVPCLPDPAGPLRIAPCALLGLIYPLDAILLPQPGYSYVRILQPPSVWHSNVSPGVDQLLCLGPSLPAGLPLKEILLMTYSALTLQSIQINALDPAGVMHWAAAAWWQQHPDRIPLTREPFLRPEASHAS